jgi:hypothetical protein
MVKQSIVSSVAEILVRDLQRTIDEVASYKDTNDLWIKKGAINNSAGNLALHIGGAVNHFIGAVLGSNSFLRNREGEFGTSDIAMDEIISQLQKAQEVVKQVLATINDEDTFMEFPVKVMDNTMAIHFFLIQLVSHINYHLGQINYHRRLLNV